VSAAVDVTEFARDSVSALSATGPIALALTCAALAVVVATPRGRSAWMLGRRGLHGRRPSARRQLLMGLAIPLIAVTSTSVSLGFERELREGPNRVLFQLVGGDGRELSWLMQADTRHFMNDSRLPSMAVARLRRSPATVLYWSQLSDMTPRTGHPITALIIARSGGGRDGVRESAPVPVDAGTARCRVTASTCALTDGEAVTDDDVAPVGATVTLRGRRLRVVAHTAKAASLLNRAVVFVTPAAFDRSDGSREAPFAAVAAGGPGRAALDAVRAGQAAPDELAVSSTAQIADANRRFWAGNGTPIMLILILLVMVFGGVAFYASRKALHEQARAEIATLLAIGVPPRVLGAAELVRTAISACVAALIGGPLAVAIVALADSQILGFHATVELDMVAASAGLMVVAGIGALVGTGLRLRRANLAEAMAA
jgi:hypothetical protein